MGLINSYFACPTPALTPASGTLSQKRHCTFTDYVDLVKKSAQYRMGRCACYHLDEAIFIFLMPYLFRAHEEGRQLSCQDRIKQFVEEYKEELALVKKRLLACRHPKTRQRYPLEDCIATIFLHLDKYDPTKEKQTDPATATEKLREVEYFNSFDDYVWMLDRAKVYKFDSVPCNHTFYQEFDYLLPYLFLAYETNTEEPIDIKTDNFMIKYHRELDYVEKHVRPCKNLGMGEVYTLRHCIETIFTYLSEHDPQKKEKKKQDAEKDAEAVK